MISISDKIDYRRGFTQLCIFYGLVAIFIVLAVPAACKWAYKTYSGFIDTPIH
jgi:hypothetical protein